MSINGALEFKKEPEELAQEMFNLHNSKTLLKIEAWGTGSYYSRSPWTR